MFPAATGVRPGGGASSRGVEPTGAPATSPPHVTDGGEGAGSLRYASRRGRIVLLATVLGSGIAFLDATVVNVALPAIGEDFDAGFAGLQWTVNAYALTLAGLLLIGGSLGDHFGRRRLFAIGVAWFAVASLLCAVAPDVEMLIAARAIQGVGAALLTPGSLAILEASFHPDDRGAAIGAWSGLARHHHRHRPVPRRVAGGGGLVAADLPDQPAARRGGALGDARHPRVAGRVGAGQRLDLTGAALTAFGLAGVTYALTEGPTSGWTEPAHRRPRAAGRRRARRVRARRAAQPHPLVPLDMFASRTFSIANGLTFLVYGALGAAFFLLPIELQIVAGFSPIASGAALVPMTVVMLLLSKRAGRLAARIGPRLPMGLGPIGAAAGLLLLLRIGPDADYVTDVLPGVIVFALGMSLTVAPLNVTVLGAAGEARAGVASAVNNAVARVAGLLAVATIPVVAGITGERLPGSVRLRRRLHDGPHDLRRPLRRGRRPGPRRHPAHRAARPGRDRDPHPLRPQRPADRDPRRAGRRPRPGRPVGSAPCA